MRGFLRLIFASVMSGDDYPYGMTHNNNRRSRSNNITTQRIYGRK